MTETPTEKIEKGRKLAASLREGVAIVQMIFYKELKDNIQKEYSDSEQAFISMLCGAITNEIFGSRNTDEKFENFRVENKGSIEQGLLSVSKDLVHLNKFLTDALRIQTLCDSQDNIDSSSTLIYAKELGILMEERETPLPSTFMTIVRTLGEKHGLIIKPAQITPEDDQRLIH